MTRQLQQQNPAGQEEDRESADVEEEIAAAEIASLAAELERPRLGERLRGRLAAGPEVG